MSIEISLFATLPEQEHFNKAKLSTLPIPKAQDSPESHKDSVR